MFGSCLLLETTVAHVSIPRVIHVLTSLYRNFPDNVELLEYMMLALSQVAAVDRELLQIEGVGDDICIHVCWFFSAVCVCVCVVWCGV